MADRKKIPQPTKLRLFFDSQGYCQNPDCLTLLYPKRMGGDKHIAEMAHVIPHGEKGPRYEERPDKEYDPDAFENLILLCPTCHTIIDKDPAVFPRAVLIEWKEQHQMRVLASLGLKAFESREDVRATITHAMDENKAIWREYAPMDGAGFEVDPESDGAKHWDHRMRSIILPNHYRIQSIIELNLHLATDAERSTFADYKEHVRGLTERHVCDMAGVAIRFPAAMEAIFACHGRSNMR